MYQRNQISRNVLITPQEVIRKSATSHTLDPGVLEAAIEIAEERFVRDAIGSDYYDYLIESKNVLVTSANKTELQQKINTAYGHQDTTDDSEIKSGDVVNSFFFLTAADQKLWLMYLWKLTAEAVIFVATPTNYATFASQGIIKNNPDPGYIGTNTNGGSVGISLNDAKWLMDKSLQDRINPMIGAMHKWLCKNIGNYPKYEGKCGCDENGDAVPGGQISGWLTSLYDDEDNGRCGC